MGPRGSRPSESRLRTPTVVQGPSGSRDAGKPRASSGPGPSADSGRAAEGGAVARSCQPGPGRGPADPPRGVNWLHSHPEFPLQSHQEFSCLATVSTTLRTLKFFKVFIVMFLFFSSHALLSQGLEVTVLSSLSSGTVPLPFPDLLKLQKFWCWLKL